MTNRNIDFYFTQILKRFKQIRADEYQKLNLLNLQNLRENYLNTSSYDIQFGNIEIPIGASYKEYAFKILKG